MQFTNVTRPQAELTVELLEYVLLRVSKYFIEDDLEMLAVSEPMTSAEMELSDFDKDAQHRAATGAYLNANTVAAYNRSIHTFEDLGIARRLAGYLSRIEVPYAGLRAHLTNCGLLSKELFEHSVYHFYDCHDQQEWRDMTRGQGTFVQIRPGLRTRFLAAGLLDADWEWHGWSELMAQCVAPHSLDDWNLTPMADEFFEQVYRPG